MALMGQFNNAVKRLGFRGCSGSYPLSTLKPHYTHPLNGLSDHLPCQA